MPPIDASEFVALLEPLLAGQDVQGATDLLRANWTPDQIAPLLQHEQCDVRKIAALAVGLVGQRPSVTHLVPLLKDPDPMVNQMAEHALWSVWLRSGSPQANKELCHGSKALNRRDYDAAFAHFTRATEVDTDFAEAYNQRAIAHYLLEEYDASISDCEQATTRMPCHFGAWAGMGHCYAHKGCLAQAVRCYERALKINPHLEGIRQAVEAMNTRLNLHEAEGA